ncbi:FecCD family ABC transporter permease [Nosocomiicoccus massiliensis]|uniref:FecCD family ABC transporter permease n=1 Tax=Nosocomiicoccus massiliensis TaxID=1232430 RepID=UPI00040226AF|nr:iron ABC transporter permease [Nosocomiicoccus massiliensis]
MNKEYVVLASILIVVILASLVIGTINVFEGHFNIVYSIRLPRILFAVLGGAVLSICGAVFQILLNNRMADSFTLGMANGAVIGAAIAIYISASFYLIPLFGVVAGLISLFLVLFIAKQIDSMLRPETLVITGVLFSTLLSGVLYIIIMLDPTKTKSIVQFMFGSFSGSRYEFVSLVFVCFIVSLVVLFKSSRDLDLLTLGELRAFSLGVDVSNLRLKLLIVMAIPSLVLLSFTGIIGFIGIIVPQMIQYIRPRKAKELFILSGLYGAILLGVVDTIARTILSPIQLPTGVLLSIFSVPLIMFLMYKRFLQKTI